MKEGDKQLQDLKDAALNKRAILTLTILLERPEYEIDWIRMPSWLYEGRN